MIPVYPSQNRSATSRGVRKDGTEQLELVYHPGRVDQILAKLQVQLLCGEDGLAGSRVVQLSEEHIVDICPQGDARAVLQHQVDDRVKPLVKGVGQRRV